MTALDEPRIPVAPPAKTVSILPAMTVVAIAVLTLVSFAVVDFVVSPSVTPTTVPAVVVGGGLKVDPTTQVFDGALQGGEPPANIATGLIAPDATRWLGDVATGGAAGVDYDLEWRLEVAAPRADLFGFYQSNLEARGWDLFSKGSAPGDQGDEVLFQKAGGDGNYWELGVIAKPTHLSRTTYLVRLYLVDNTE